MNFENHKKSVIEGSLECVSKGLIKGTSGNISIADREAGIFVITPSGIPYEELRPSDIPVLSLKDGSVVEGELKPSKEAPMHLAILQLKPVMNSVVHTHSLYATVMSSILESELPAVTVGAAPYMPAKIATYAIPGSQEIAQGAAHAMEDKDLVACLLKYHGQITAGTTMKAAITAAEFVEDNAHAAYLTLAATGSLKPVPFDDYNFIHERALKSMGIL